MEPYICKISEVEHLRSDMVNELNSLLPEFRLAACFVNPRAIKNGSEKFQRKLESKVFKNNAGLNLRTATAGMFNGASPKTREWFASMITNPLTAKNTEVKQYLKNDDNIISEHFKVNNTYRVLPLLYRDAMTFSTSACLMLPHAIYGFWLYPLAMGTYSFACDAEGRPEMFCRDFVYTVKQVVDTYATYDKNGAVDWTNIHPFVKDCYDKSLYNEKVHLTTVILPNKNYRANEVNAFNPLDKKFHAYTYIQRFSTASGQLSNMSIREIRRNGETKGNNLSDFLKVTGFDYFPVIISRWELQAEENFGTNGPTQVAIADIMTYQEMQRKRLNAVDKSISPPMVAPAHMRRHQSSILAGGITYVENMDQNSGFRPAFMVDAKVAELIGDMAEYKELLDEAYYVDLFKMLIGQDLKSHVSAQEIQSRTGEKLQLLGPAFNQWDFDIGSILIGNARHLLGKMGRLTEKPKALLDSGNDDVRIEYVSTLALAQKAGNLTTMERTFGVAAQVAQAHNNPAYLKILPPEIYIRTYADSIGLDPNLLLTEDEFAQEMQKDAQQQQAMAAQQQQIQGAEIAKTLSEAKTGQGSMLDNMLAAGTL